MNNFPEFLNNISKKPLLVLDESIPLSDYTSIDLSKKKADLKTFDTSSSKAWGIYINKYLNEKKAKVAFGGYLEERNLYDRSNFFQSTPKEPRNIHLGIDLWTKKNTRVLSALDGKIHSFQNNKNYGDYGPTIIIEHHIGNIKFFTLYGHLSIKSIENLKVGQKIFKGECIGFLGDASVNGDYAPHLHFQIIIDVENNFGDYPGVSSRKYITYYTKNCPNPNFLLKL